MNALNKTTTPRNVQPRSDSRDSSIEAVGIRVSPLTIRMARFPVRARPAPRRHDHDDT